MTILNRIVLHKKTELIELKKQYPVDTLLNEISSTQSTPRFWQAIRQHPYPYKIIAEIKQASPSKGLLTENFDVQKIAKSYTNQKACCLSILTETYFFKGDSKNIELARTVSSLPILRKDFIVDPWQVYESAYLKADCILLICSILSDKELLELYQLATTLGLDVLIEIHDEEELNRALKVNPTAIGINNRNLHTFETNIEVSCHLSKKIPEDILIISESGIHSKNQLTFLKSHGIDIFLIGESLMKSDLNKSLLTESLD